MKTAKEQGLNFYGTMWRGVLAPKGAPADLIKRLDSIFKKCVNDPDFQKQARENMWPIKYLNSKDFKKFMQDEDKRYKKLIIENKLGDRYRDQYK